MIMQIRYAFLLATALFSASGANAQQHYKRAHNRMLDEAKALMAAGEYLNASRIYRKLIPVDTTFADNYYEMGYCLARVPGQREKAYAYLEKAVAHGHTEAHYELAMARHRQQRFDEAIELFADYKGIYYREVQDAEVDRAIAMCRLAK